MASHLVSLWKWDFLELDRKWPMYSAVLSSTLSTYVFQLSNFPLSLKYPQPNLFLYLKCLHWFSTQNPRNFPILVNLPKKRNDNKRCRTHHKPHPKMTWKSFFLQNCSFYSTFCFKIRIEGSRWCQVMSVKNPFNECKVKSPQLYFFQQPHKTLLTSGDPQYVNCHSQKYART